MRYILLALAIASAANSLPAQRTLPSKPKQEPPCTVAGRVVTAAEGNPLKSAYVILIQEHGGSEPNVYGATTDSDGRFLLKNVAPGRYQFSANRTGYVTEHYGSNGTNTGAVFALRPGQEVADVLFRMTQAAVITGRVSDEDSEPMANIQIAALRKRSEEEIEDEGPFASRQQELIPAASARTDDRGQYRLFGVKPGDYYIRATDSVYPGFDGVMDDGLERFARERLGSQYASVFYPGVVQLSQAEVVSVTAGQETQIDFTMRHIRTVTVSGRVIAADGKPANALVDLQEVGVQDYGLGHSSEQTDSDGRFTIRGVPPGSYFLVVMQQQSDHEYSGRARQKIEVGSENIDSVMVALGRGSDFHGQVTADGLPLESAHIEGVYINLRPVGADDPMTIGTPVKKDGTFDLKDVPDGDYAVMAFVEGTGWFLKSARLGPDDILNEGLHVERESSGGTISIVISSTGAQLEGSVTEADKPVLGAHVRISPDPQTAYNGLRWKTTTTDQNGHFVIPGIAPGKYRVVARSPMTPGSTPARSAPQTVTLSEHGHEAVQLVMEPPQGQ